MGFAAAIGAVVMVMVVVVRSGRLQTAAGHTVAGDPWELGDGQTLGTAVDREVHVRSEAGS